MSEKATAETMLKVMQDYIRLQDNQKEFINGFMMGVMQTAQSKPKNGGQTDRIGKGTA